MTMVPTIAVTGAAGKTGRAVTAALSARGVAVRALVHRPEQIGQITQTTRGEQPGQTRQTGRTEQGDGEAASTDGAVQIDQAARAADEPARGGNQAGRAADEPARGGNQAGRAADEPARAGNQTGRAADEPAWAGNQTGWAADEPARAGTIVIPATATEGSVAALAVDMADAAAMAAALDGVDALYLMAPNMHPDEPALLQPILDGCAQAGPRRVVYHSVIHPYLPQMPHHMGKAQVEAALYRSGLDWTILQPASYLENALGVWESVRHRGIWPLPYAAETLFTPVALADVAEVAAWALTTGAGLYATWELAGPELLSTADMARQAAEVLGRDVRVEVDRDRSDAAARPPRLQAMFDYYHEHGPVGSGLVLEAVLARANGRAPMTWRQWVAAHRE